MGGGPVMGLLQRLLGRQGGGSASSGRAVWLGAFGKHPGWDDHAEDIGLETPGLVEVKRAMYVAGIGGNIDTGAWSKLGEKALPGFDHDFVWSQGRTSFAGRLWASTDAKGRSRYPMVVAGEFREMPSRVIARQAWGAFDEAETGCKRATTPAGVRAAMDAARSALLASVSGWPLTAPPVGDPLVRLAASAASWGGAEGLARVLYQIETDLRGFGAGSGDTKRTVNLENAGRHLRLPCIEPDRPGEDFAVWLELLESRFTGLRPSVLLLRPRNGAWMDVVVGTVQPVSFYCLLAGREAMPPAQEIPYELDMGLLTRARALLAASVSRTG